MATGITPSSHSLNRLIHSGSITEMGRVSARCVVAGLPALGARSTLPLCATEAHTGEAGHHLAVVRRQGKDCGRDRGDRGCRSFHAVSGAWVAPVVLTRADASYAFDGHSPARRLWSWPPASSHGTSPRPSLSDACRRTSTVSGEEPHTVRNSHIGGSGDGFRNFDNYGHIYYCAARSIEILSAVRASSWPTPEEIPVMRSGSSMCRCQ
jgi:hypothetical protein